MENKKFSDVIVTLRKEKGYTQQELASKLHITDKAVSKWERGLSYPDIASISALANALGVDSSYLLDLCKKEDSINPYQKKENINQMMILIEKAIGIAMGVGVVVLNILGELPVKDAITMLGIGVLCLSLSLLSEEKQANNPKKYRNINKNNIS